MKRISHLFWILAVTLASLSASAQGVISIGDIDTYIFMLGQECPIEYNDAWAINDIVIDGDTIRLELQMPSSLSGFLPMLTGEGDNVKRMWMRQLKIFGYPWDEIIGRLAKQEYPLVITFHPKDSRKTAEIIFLPEDFAAFIDAEQLSESQGSESSEDSQVIESSEPIDESQVE